MARSTSTARKGPARKAATATAKRPAAKAAGKGASKRSTGMATKRSTTKAVTKHATANATARRATTGPAARRVAVLVATRKGAWIFHGDAARRNWKADGPHFLGHIVNHLVLDPRAAPAGGKTLLAAAKTGHLGPTVFRSTDLGRTWKEAARPPAFDKAADGAGENAGEHAGENAGEMLGRVVDHTFWLVPGHASEPGVWYAGTSPQGLFRSDDDGVTWHGASYINSDPQYVEWMGAQQDGTPDGPKMHSILIDPRDKDHMYFAMSSGGVHETTDGGKTFKPLVAGLEVVEGFDPNTLTFHDPHCVRMSPSNPDRLWQQNHCGIYRLDRPGTTWERVGKAMPKKIGDVGFPMVVHPRNADVAWVFPMDGSSVWPRISIDGKPAVYGTKNGGKTWTRMAAGMPAEQGWWTVKRQAMCADAQDAVGLYFGTTSGEVWASRDEGAKWSCIARHLPEIYAVETAEVA